MYDVMIMNGYECMIILKLQSPHKYTKEKKNFKYV